MTALLTLGVLVLLANLLVLGVIVKIYTEIQKTETIKRIGKP